LVGLLREHVCFLKDFALCWLKLGLALDPFGVSFVEEFDHTGKPKKLSDFLLKIKAFIKIQLGEGIEALRVKLEQRVEVFLVKVSRVNFEL
jgi:hypothetical protein